MFEMCTFALPAEQRGEKREKNGGGGSHPTHHKPVWTRKMKVNPNACPSAFPHLELRFPQPSSHLSQLVNQAWFSSHVLCGETLQSHFKEAKSTTWLPTLVWSVDPQHSTRLRLVINLLHCCCGCRYANITSALGKYSEFLGNGLVTLRNYFTPFNSQHSALSC